MVRALDMPSSLHMYACVAKLWMEIRPLSVLIGIWAYVSGVIFQYIYFLTCRILVYQHVNRINIFNVLPSYM